MRSWPELVEGLRLSAIPAGHVRPHVNAISLLLWVRNGMASVTVAGQNYCIAEGSAIWVPAGTPESVQLSPGSVMIPIPIHTSAPSELTVPRTLQVPPGWGEWLIHKRGFGPIAADLPLIELAGRHYLSHGEEILHPPMPTSVAARAVAHSLLQSPGLPFDAAQHAARQNISTKTLLRRFPIETGLSFSTWRTRARVTVAALRIRAGEPIGRTAHEVGYTTVAGFTRAFQRQFGCTPSQFRARSHTPQRRADQTVAGAVADQTVAGAVADQTVAGAVTDPQRAALRPPPIPAYSDSMRINDYHLLHWLHRGTARLEVGTRSFDLAAGDLIWVPAGITHRIRIDPDSLLVLLGHRYRPVHCTVSDLQIFSVPPRADPYLLYLSTVELGLVEPSRSPTFVDDLFDLQFGTGEPGSGTARSLSSASPQAGALGRVAATLRRNPSDRRCLAQWASAVGISPDRLSAELRAQTGTTFPRWRSQLRMDLARNLLYSGRTSSEVSRILGYARPSAFIKVFTAAHGIPPGEYVRREITAS